MFSPELLRQRVTEVAPGRRYVVAFSGGLDSTVLLHGLATLRRHLAAPLLAIHVDHGLQPLSPEWARSCSDFCLKQRIPFASFRVDARAEAGESPEAAARAARYAVFRTLVEPGDLLLTAHHLDDQAETLLLQLMRGAGPRGLGAIAASARFGAGHLFRPLLTFTRAELQAYAEAEGLSWVEDPSNGDTRYERNFIRREVIPLLASRSPAVSRTIARSAALCGEASLLLEELAAIDWEVVKGRSAGSLKIPALLSFSRPRARNLLRFWLKGRGLPLPDGQRLERLLTEVATAREDAEPCVSWQGAEVRRYREELFAFPPSSPPPPADLRLPWLPPAGIALPPPLGRLTVEEAVGQGIRQDVGPLEIGFRRGGERCRPQGAPYSRELKKLLQERGVPPWERKPLPLVFLGEDLVAVAGLWVCEPYGAVPGEPGWIVRWERSTVETDG